MRITNVQGVPIRIKSGHGYRAAPNHGSMDITSVLSRDAVDAGIAKHLAGEIKKGTTIRPVGTGHSTLSTTINGYTVEYNAVFLPSSGLFDVSTYYIR
jgi:hypothetical protein